MNKISGVVICYNEELNIRNCILSLQKVCDEIIVLDSFSTDKTPEICNSLEVIFIQRIFDSYGVQKIAATDFATNPFILSLDADEQLSEPLINEIINLKKSEMAGAYLIPRLTNYCGEWVYYCGWYPDRKIRLWNSSLARWTSATLHETVEINSKKVLVQRLKNNIQHYSYRTVEDHYDRIEKYTNIQAETDFKKGKRTWKFKKYLSAAWKFIDIYLFKLGLMDGQTGYAISKRSAYYQYLKLSKLYKLQRLK
ncbi:MAG: glycosyltransferase family 2 protein [Saprospiraceae bacterium]